MTIKSILLALPFVFTGWITTLAVIGLVSDEAPAQVVMFPTDTFLKKLPLDVAIISAGQWSIIVTSKKKNFAKSLYALGAKIVLPSGLQGCGTKL